MGNLSVLQLEAPRECTYISTIIDGGMQDPCIAIRADELEATVRDYPYQWSGFLEWQTDNYRCGGGYIFTEIFNPLIPSR